MAHHLPELYGKLLRWSTLVTEKERDYKNSKHRKIGMMSGVHDRSSSSDSLARIKRVPFGIIRITWPKQNS